MNKIVIAGRIVKKPELKQTNNGKYVCDFGLAVNRGIKDQSGIEEVDFINCRCWNKLAENLCKYQDKGSFIIVEGNFRSENYTDKNGNKRYISYVMVENIEYTPKQRQEAQNEPNKAQETNTNWDSAQDIELSEEELPFYGN